LARHVIDIDYPAEEMEASRRRMAARASYTYTDRVPVGFCLVPRYFTPLFDIPYRAIFESAEAQFRWQLEFLKYRLENVPEDIVCHGPALAVGPYFDNVLDSAALGAEIIWPENETLHSMPTLRTVEQMVAWEAPAPGTGLWGQARDWWLEMRELARETKLTFNGQEGHVDVPVLGIGGLSPHMIAIDLAGTDFYAWQLECPAQCHEFLSKITRALIAAHRYFMEIDPRPRGGFGLAEDTAAVLSPAQFREFCAPYSRMLYDTFSPNPGEARGLHICGKSAHLHAAFLEELRITSLDLFGYMVTPEVAARNLGGRVLLWGNINPMLMLDGTKAQVKQAARELLEGLAPCGGLLLGDGANVCPGTPLENLAALTEAAEEYGVPPGREAGA
jgi:uroporphyrinogen-III decarboxylase